MLRGYVEGGGCVLLIGAAPSVDQGRLGWSGLRPEASPWQDHIYLPAWDGEPEILVRGDFHRAELDGAETICRAIPGWDARHGHRYGWGIGPACAEPSPHPILARNQLGKGQIWTLCVPLFTDYARHGNWQQAIWLKGLLDRMGFARRAFLDASSFGVELVFYEEGKTSWAVLVHHAGEQLIERWARNVGPLPRTEVRLRVDRKGRDPRRVVSDRREVPFDAEGGWLTVPVAMKDVWKVVRVEWV
jgi:hypothetical protein